MSTNRPVPGAPPREMARVELVFGTRRRGGLIVSENEWQAFVEAEILPRFPAGFTVLVGEGRWLHSTGRQVRDPVHVVVIWYEPDATSEERIEALRSAYRTVFGLESVLRADGQSLVSF